MHPPGQGQAAPEERLRHLAHSLPLLGLLILLPLVAGGCGRHGKGAPSGGTDVPPSQTKLKRNVELGTVEMIELTSYVDTVGVLEAEGETPIAPSVSGLVDEVLFREGQWVDPGTILVKIDQRRYQTALEVARAAEKRAVANLTLSRDMERIAASAGIGATPEEKVKLAGSTRLADAELATAKASRELAELNLERSQVRAPFAGQINSRKVYPGTYVEEKTIIGSIADVNRLRLVGFIPEKAAPMVRQMMMQEELCRAGRLFGARLTAPLALAVARMAEEKGAVPSPNRLEFRLRPYPGQVFFARIFYMSTVANPDTHMFECKAEVPLHEIKAEVRPGYTAKIRCPLPGNPNTLVVPEESVRSSERGDILFIPRPVPGKDDEWVAQEVVVTIGQRKPGPPGLAEVQRALLPGDREIRFRPGDLIVQKGAESLENGTPLSIPEAQKRQLTSRLTTRD
jgi:RND family efflux transporter MFP subunit